MVQFGMTPPPYHAALPGGGMTTMGGVGGMGGMGGMGGGLGLSGMGGGGGSGASIAGMAYSQPGTAGAGGGYGGVGFGLPGGGNPSAAGVVGGAGGLGMLPTPEGMFGMSLHGEQPYMSNLSISALTRGAGANMGSVSGASLSGYGSQRPQMYGHGQALAMATAQYMAQGYGKGCVLDLFFLTAVSFVFGLCVPLVSGNLHFASRSGTWRSQYPRPWRRKDEVYESERSRRPRCDLLSEQARPVACRLLLECWMGQRAQALKWWSAYALSQTGRQGRARIWISGIPRDHGLRRRAPSSSPALAQEFAGLPILGHFQPGHQAIGSNPFIMAQSGKSDLHRRWTGQHFENAGWISGIIGLAHLETGGRRDLGEGSGGLISCSKPAQAAGRWRNLSLHDPSSSAQMQSGLGGTEEYRGRRIILPHGVSATDHLGGLRTISGKE